MHTTTLERFNQIKLDLWGLKAQPDTFQRAKRGEVERGYAAARVGLESQAADHICCVFYHLRPICILNIGCTLFKL
jgi:hypothetical protein